MLLLCYFLAGCNNKTLVINSQAINGTYRAGKLTPADTVIKHTFLIKSTGTGELKIDTAIASCDCVTLNWEKQPIKPGNTGFINVVVKPNQASKGNKIVKYVMVKTNATNPLTSFNVLYSM